MNRINKWTDKSFNTAKKHKPSNEAVDAVLCVLTTNFLTIYLAGCCSTTVECFF